MCPNSLQAAAPPGLRCGGQAQARSVMREVLLCCCRQSALIKSNHQRLSKYLLFVHFPFKSKCIHRYVKTHCRRSGSQSNRLCSAVSGSLTNCISGSAGGHVNSCNALHWGHRHSVPDKVLTKPLHSDKVTVWIAMGGVGVQIGMLFFFEPGRGVAQTINAERYLKLKLPERTEMSSTNVNVIHRFAIRFGIQ